jgi:hypothetical protein
MPAIVWSILGGLMVGTLIAAIVLRRTGEQRRAAWSVYMTACKREWEGLLYESDSRVRNDDRQRDPLRH